MISTVVGTRGEFTCLLLSRRGMVLVLRHQLHVLRRQVQRPKLEPLTEPVGYTARFPSAPRVLLETVHPMS